MKIEEIKIDGVRHEIVKSTKIVNICSDCLFCDSCDEHLDSICLVIEKINGQRIVFKAKED